MCKNNNKEKAMTAAAEQENEKMKNLVMRCEPIEAVDCM
jgi:hypothetical protein